MKNRKSIIIAIIVSLFLGFVIWFGCNFAPGSYPYAEKYELNYSEEKIKKAIAKFKQEYPEYIVPKIAINSKGSWDLDDGQSKEPDYWYGIYFYYKNENRIVFAWTRPIDNNKTTFAFISINDGLNLGHWKTINKDFSRSENRAEIKKFEERILNKIKAILKED